jgi:hypothetical protein
MAITSNDVARELRELITALDRRLPRVERAGEAGIAQDAAALREKAVRRLSELEEQSPAAVREHGAAPIDKSIPR